MPNLPNLGQNLIETIEAILAELKPIAENRGLPVILRYSLRQPPMALLEVSKGTQYPIPLPQLPRPFNTWGEWFTHELKPAIFRAARRIRVQVYTLAPDGKILLLTDDNSLTAD